MKCPKCDGEMEEGRLPGFPFGISQKWIQLTKFLTLKQVMIKEIKSFRCQSCGYLENYAK